MVVRGPAGRVGQEQQGSLRLRTLGEGGAGCFDPSPHRGGVWLAGAELGALGGAAEASQDPAHRCQGQLDWELVEDPWPDNLQRPVGELELELVRRFVPQSFEDHFPVVVGEAGRASRLGLLSESLASAAGLEPKPGADCEDADAEVLGRVLKSFAVAGLDHDQLPQERAGPMENASEAAHGWEAHESVPARVPGRFHATMSQIQSIYRAVHVCVDAGELLRD